MTVPEWCRPGAPAVITTGRDEHADTAGRDMWRAVTIVDVRPTGHVIVKATPPYSGRQTFLPDGPDRRPDNLDGYFLAPADAPDVIRQRRRRDLTKHHKPLSNWALTDEGWQVVPRFGFDPLEAQR